MAIGNYNIPDWIHKKFAYYVIEKEGKFIQHLNVNMQGHSDNLMYEIGDL